MLPGKRLTALFFVAIIFFSPIAKAQKITLLEKHASLQKIFRAIEKQSSFLFWYEYPVLAQSSTVSIHVSNVSINEALDICLRDQPLKYTIVGNTIVITGADDAAAPAKGGELPVQLSGIVTDTAGVPLEGVTVSAADAKSVTKTDFGGTFRVAAALPSRLRFSLVSYQAAEKLVSAAGEIHVVMKVSNSNMNGVVVVGYGSLSKRSLTGSVSSISARSIQNQPLSSFDQAIAGQAAGVQVSQLTGSPGGGVSVRVRGTGSISAGNEPLYVIDGFPIEGSYNRDLNPLATINVNDIESILVLKDASSVAIYGARGSNGVVLVTTKRGLADRTRVQFDSYYGMQEVAHKIDMLDAGEYAAYNTEARNNAWADLGGNADDPDSVRPDRLKIPPIFQNAQSLGKGTDWQDEVFHRAVVQSYNVSVSGGKEGTRYLFSAGHFNQEGIVRNTGFQRSSVRFNFDSKLFEKIKFGFNISPTYSKNRVLQVDDQIFQGSILGSALAMPPAIPVYNADGSYTTLLKTTPYNLGAVNNPVAIANRLTEGTTAFRTLAGAFAEWEIAKGLRLKSSVGADYYEDRFRFYWPSDLGRGGSAPPVISEGIATASRRFVWLVENTLSWNASLSNAHLINAVAGATSQKSHSEDAALDAVYFPTDDVTTLNAGQIASGSTGISEWSLSSLLARVNYSYKSKYLVTATIRRDGSSRFGPHTKWGTFPSVSVGWNVSKEAFMQPVRFVNELKIRGSYGYAGNNTIGNYSYLGLLTYDHYVFGPGNGNFVDGLQASNIANPNLGWEVMKQTDVGMDISLFGNRAFIVVDYFDKITSDLLLNVPVPASIGFATALQNIGKVSNKGWELSVTSNNLVRAFRWTTTINVSSNRNKVLELGKNGDPIIASSSPFNAQTHITAIGQPIGSFYGYKTIGVYRDQADVDKSAKVEGPGGSRPGDLKFRDVNDDGTITALDMTIIGHSNPDLIYSFTNEFSFKKLSLSVLIDGIHGAQVLNGARKNIGLTTGSYSRRDVLGRWQSAEQPGDGKTPRANVAPTGGNVSFISSLLVEDASFLRIKNVNLRYAFRTKAKYIDGFSLFVSVQNALTITRYRGYNPEQSYNGTSALTPGGDFNGYPLARVVSAGVNVAFQ